jgi:hypothetical protein
MINDYPNLIEFLKLALMFYANEDNYISTITTDSMINIDKGHNARYALEQIDIVREANEKMDDDLLKKLSEIKIENPDDMNMIITLLTNKNL